MKRILIPFILLTFWLTNLSAQIKSPEEFLGYKIGERFTRHHAVVDYYQHLAESNPNMKLITYGETYEFRPLVLAIISSAENMKKLEEIREDNLKRAGLMDGEPAGDKKAIVWLSYNVHGNEASSIEASMMTAYELLSGKNSKTEGWLDEAIIIIDPAVNPDGRDRYANFYNQFAGKNYNPNGDAMEHHEPWPGGRPNHYLFDLNRDWAWQTQVESATRSVVYHDWMPHVHVDFHEQGYNSPYYFAPAAEPFHEVITPWQREFQTMIGKNNAKYFDENGWLYFTKERFDLLYPSYGDTYPTYNGAIGMTYEQAGHGFAGLGIITEYGDTLTLRDRALHHHTTGLSTVEITAENAEKVVEEFEKYFSESSSNPKSRFKSYIISGENNADKKAQLLRFLDKHKIRYGLAPVGGRGISVYDYNTQKNTSYSLKQGDIVVSAYQPLGKLATVFFEPQTKLSDTLTYDITAWSLPYVFGVQAYASESRINPAGAYKKAPAQMNEMPEKPYAYVANYESFEDAKYLAHLLAHDINVRVSTVPFSIDGKNYNRGSLVITRRTNERLGDKFDKMVREGAQKLGRNINGVTTGFVTRGSDFGSGNVRRIEKPKIAVLAGEQTSSLSFGEIWHFFERQLEYPITAVRTDYIDYVDLEDYNVFVIPNGYYRLFDESMRKKLSSWVRDGGNLILVGNATNSFANSDEFGLKKYEDDAEKKEFEKAREEVRDSEKLHPFEDLERDRLSRSIFGAIYKLQLDNTHPLAYGYDNNYFTLKTNSLRFAYLDGSGNVGILKGEADPVAGYAGTYANRELKDSMVFGVESKGSGNVIYMVDNPLFRAFWENGKLLFSNAVFMVD